MKYDLNLVSKQYYDVADRDGCVFLIPDRAIARCREVAVFYWMALAEQTPIDEFFISYPSDISPDFSNKCEEFGIKIETESCKFGLRGQGKLHSFKVPEIFRYNSVGMYIFVDIIRTYGLKVDIYEKYEDTLIKAYIQNHESWFNELNVIKGRGPMDMLLGNLNNDHEVELFCRMIRSLPPDTDIFKYLFVYGSLRRTKNNYKHYLMKNLEFVVNKDLAGIKRLGSIQAIRSSLEFQISGEVWRVRKAGDLVALLDYEGHPYSWRLVPTRQDHSLFFEYQLGE